MSLIYDKEKRQKSFMYSLDQERQYILEAQKCQRNWNHKKIIHPAARDHLLWVAQNAPSKQHEGYYDIYWSDNRKVLQELSEYTWGNTHSRLPPANFKNSQQNASLYILFVAKEPSTQLNCNADGTLKKNTHPERWKNAYVSVGIAMGCVLLSANKMGLSTGFLDEIAKGTKLITYGIGIGFPQINKERYESDQTELMIGAGNGSNITTSDMEKHPRTGLQMRKVKIVDIKENAGKKIEDPYGNYHTIPDEATTKINTPRLRDIKLTEIK